PHDAQPVAAQDAGGKIADDGELAVTLFQVPPLDHQLAGKAGVARGHSREPLRRLVIAPALSQRLQFGKPPHIAPAPRSDAVAQPMLLAGNPALQPLLLALF